MSADDRLTYKLLALLLEYPDEAWQNALGDLHEVVAAVPEPARQEVFRQFLAYVAATAPIELEEAYTNTFDLDPARSLHLTYHLMGDSEDRGKTLTALLHLYQRQGFVPTGRQLPDYLPLILEFLSLSREPEMNPLLQSCLTTIAPLADHLEKEQHAHAGLLQLAAELVQAHPKDTTTCTHKEA